MVTALYYDFPTHKLTRCGARYFPATGNPRSSLPHLGAAPAVAFSRTASALRVSARSPCAVLILAVWSELSSSNAATLTRSSCDETPGVSRETRERGHTEREGRKTHLAQLSEIDRRVLVPLV